MYYFFLAFFLSVQLHQHSRLFYQCVDVVAVCGNCSIILKLITCQVSGSNNNDKAVADDNRIDLETWTWPGIRLGLFSLADGSDELKSATPTATAATTRCSCLDLLVLSSSKMRLLS